MSRAPKLNLIQPEIRGQDPRGRDRGAKLLSDPGRFFRDGAPAVPGRIFPDDLCTLPVNGAALHHRTEESSATATDPIRSLFAYYVWFTVVYQGKSGSARGRGAV